MNKQHFFRPDEAVSGEVLHYKECGLDNIYLLNGFTKEEYEGEEYVSVADIDGLNAAIGLHIVLHRKAPSCKEIRFLRNQLDMSQADLADILGVSDQSVARWEKGVCEAPGPAVLALRVIFILSNVDEERRQEFLDTMLQTLRDLVDSDEIDDTAKFAYEDKKWAEKTLMVA